jgi:signal transduction histidine kinase
MQRPWKFLVIVLLSLVVAGQKPCAVWFVCPAYAQEPSRIIDSLENVRQRYQTAKKQDKTQDIALVNVLNELAEAYSARIPSKALTDYALPAQMLAERLGYKRGLAETRRIIGYIYTQQGVYDKGIENLYAALKLYEELNDKANIARTHSNIGSTYSLEANYRAAEESYNQAMRMYQQIGDQLGLAGLYNNIGSVYFEEGNDSLALENYEQAQRIYQQLGDVYRTAYTVHNIAGMYKEREEFDRAIQYFIQAIALLEKSNKSNNDKTMLATAYYNLSDVYLATNVIPKALENAQQALRLAEETGLRSIKQYAYQVLSNIYLKKGNTAKAFGYFRLAEAQKDSIYNDNITKVTQEIKARYQVEKAQSDVERAKLQIKALESQKEVADLRIQQQGQQQRNLLVMLGLVLVILGLFMYGYRIKQRSETQLQRSNLDLEAANKEIHRQNHHLEELNNEKNEFLGIVAHDLKNPILSIKLLAQLLHDHGHLTDEERMRFSSTIIGSSDQMARIINNLLDVNAIERGGMNLQPVAFDLAVAAYGVFEEYEALAQAKGVKLHFASETDAECFADQTATLQVMDNLVSNALKYSPSGKNVYIRVTGDCQWTSAATLKEHVALTLNGNIDEAISAKRTHALRCVRFEVSDEGPGLTQDDKRKLFGKFVRLSAQPTNGEGSTGLGLSIVKKMVTAMHGQVWCESDVGAGATFIVELPQYAYADHSEDTQHSEFAEDREKSAKNAALMEISAE